MATNIASLPGIKLNTPAEVENDFLDKLLEKSRENKIDWKRIEGGFAGFAIDGRLRFKLLVGTGFLGPNWSSFSVTRDDKEILRLEYEPSNFMALAGLGTGNQSKKLTELLAFLESARTKDLKAAISELAEL